MPLEQKTAWLAKQQAEFAARLLDLADAKVTAPDALSMASKAMVMRMISAQNAMGCLGTYLHPKFNVSFDLMTLLRTMYDTHLQALYMTASVDTAESRAQTFLDYDAVDKLDLLRLWKHNRSAFSTEMLRRVNLNPTRDEDIARFESIASKFKTPPGAKRPHKDTWWGGGLHQLAADKAINLLAEYEILQRLLSGALHANPATILWTGSALPPDLCVLSGGHLTIRVAGRLATCRGVALDLNMRTVLDSAWQPIL